MMGPPRLGSLCLLAACVLLATAPSLGAPASARAATPGHTDVMFVFDTSGSMSGALEEAKLEIQQVMANISAALPNVDFGLAEVRDYGGSLYDEGEPEVVPWKLDVPLTSNVASVNDAIGGLTALGGGDEPEAYGRALWETDTNPTVGWRPEASHVIVLVADNVPHDEEVNEGIPEADWAEPSPWNTGEELPGTWGIPDTQWVAGDNLNFQSVLQQLQHDGKPLETVDYHDTSVNYLPYGEHWAGAAGGQAVESNSGELAGRLTTLAKEGARVAPNNEFVTLYSKPLPRLFHLATPTPGLLEIPFGAELIPSLTFSARVQPTDPVPTVDEGNGASFFGFGPFSFSLADLEWHSSAGGPATTGGLFAGTSLGFEDQLGLLGAPTLDDGEKKPLEAAFSVPIAAVEASLGPISFPSTDTVTPEAKIGAAVDLNVKLYIAQAVAYAAEKLTEGAVAAASAILTDGVDTGLVVDALDVQQTAEIAKTAEQYAGLVLKAKTLWNMTVNQGIPIAQLLGQLVSSEAPQLLSQVAAKVAATFKHAIKWVANGVSHVVSGIYSGGVWVVEGTGKVISGAGHVISKGWHLVTGIFSAKRLAPSVAFEALPIHTLAAEPLRAGRRLGFGSHVLTRRAARGAARVLVKYGFNNATVRPLLISNGSPRPRGRLCVAGGRLTKAGTAVLELSGPRYRGEALLRTRAGVGGACLRMPSKMRAGKWTVGIVDYNSHGARSGVLLDAYSFAIRGRRPRRHRGAKH